MGVVAQAVQHLQPVDPGQDQVQQQQVRRIGRHHVHGRLGVRSMGDQIALALE